MGSPEMFGDSWKSVEMFGSVQGFIGMFRNRPTAQLPNRPVCHLDKWPIGQLATWPICKLPNWLMAKLASRPVGQLATEAIGQFADRAILVVAQSGNWPVGQHCHSGSLATSGNSWESLEVFRNRPIAQLPKRPVGRLAN